MAPWVRRVFIDVLPRFLCMQRPDNSPEDDKVDSATLNYPQPHMVDFGEKPSVIDYEHGSYSLYPGEELQQVGLQPDINGSLDGYKTSPTIEKAVLDVRFIAQHMENLDNFSDVSD